MEADNSYKRKENGQARWRMCLLVRVPSSHSFLLPHPGVKKTQTHSQEHSKHFQVTGKKQKNDKSIQTWSHFPLVFALNSGMWACSSLCFKMVIRHLRPKSGLWNKYSVTFLHLCRTICLILSHILMSFTVCTYACMCVCSDTCIVRRKQRTSSSIVYPQGMSTLVLFCLSSLR